MCKLTTLSQRCETLARRGSTFDDVELENPRPTARGLCNARLGKVKELARVLIR